MNLHAGGGRRATRDVKARQLSIRSALRTQGAKLFGPLRHRLTAVLSVVLLVPTTLDIIGAIDTYHDSVTRVHRGVRQYGILASSYENSLLWQSDQIMLSVAGDLTIKAAATGTEARRDCEEALARAIRPYQAYSALILFDLAGSTICQAGISGTGIEVGGNDWFRDVVRSQSRAVSGYIAPPGVSEPGIAIGQPVLDGEGRIAAVLGILLKISWLNAATYEPGLPSSGVVYLLDREGLILAGSDSSPRSVHPGAPPAAALQDMILKKQLEFESIGEDAAERLYAVTPLEHDKLFVLFGLPKAEFLQPIRLELKMRIAGIASVWLAGILAAWIGTRWLVTRWTDRLTTVANSMIGGDLSARADLTRAPDEFRLLGSTLAALAERVAARAAELQASLDEKQIMLREIHHRVKNNLQTVSSLLNLHSRGGRSREPKQVFSEIQTRINALALVHRHLYESEDMKSIDVEPFLVGLCRLLQAGSGVSPRRVAMIVKVDRLRLAGEQVVPLALLTTELLTNAFKHAFPDGRAGSIRVELAVAGDEAVVTVADDGIGSSESSGAASDDDASAGLGMSLIDAFARQLGGELVRSGPPGTVATLRFATAPSTADGRASARADGASAPPAPADGEARREQGRELQADKLSDR